MEVIGQLHQPEWAGATANLAGNDKDELLESGSLSTGRATLSCGRSRPRLRECGDKVVEPLMGVDESEGKKDVAPFDPKSVSEFVRTRNLPRRWKRREGKNLDANLPAKRTDGTSSTLGVNDRQRRFRGEMAVQKPTDRARSVKVPRNLMRCQHDRGRSPLEQPEQCGESAAEGGNSELNVDDLW